MAPMTMFESMMSARGQRFPSRLCRRFPFYKQDTSGRRVRYRLIYGLRIRGAFLGLRTSFRLGIWCSYRCICAECIRLYRWSAYRSNRSFTGHAFRSCFTGKKIKARFSRCAFRRDVIAFNRIGINAVELLRILRTRTVGTGSLANFFSYGLAALEARIWQLLEAPVAAQAKASSFFQHSL